MEKVLRTKWGDALIQATDYEEKIIVMQMV